MFVCLFVRPALTFKRALPAQRRIVMKRELVRSVCMSLMLQLRWACFRKTQFRFSSKYCSLSVGYIGELKKVVSGIVFFYWEINTYRLCSLLAVF